MTPDERPPAEHASADHSSTGVTRTRAFDALGWPFAVASDDPDLVAYVSELYAGLPDAPSDAPVHRYRIVADQFDGQLDGQSAAHEVVLDGDRVGTNDDASALVTTIVHDVNRHAIDTSSWLLAHAGGVVGATGAVVLPAHQEAGKTTLTTGLVRGGFGYLTDEAVAFDWDTLEITAYAKPLSLDPGSWPLFPQLEPQGPFDGDGYKDEQWQVTPGAIRAGAVVPSAHARFVVFPRYRPGAPTQLLPIRRAEGVVELAKNTFHFREHGRRALDALARLVLSVDCYRLDVGELDAAVAAITDLAGVPA